MCRAWGLLLNNDSFDDVVAIINPSDFYLTAHQYIFKGISALIETGIQLCRIVGKI